MTAHKDKEPSKIPMSEDALELELSRLAKQESADVQRAGLMESAPHEEDILAAFRRKLDEPVRKPRSTRRWVWPVLAAASLLMIFTFTQLGGGPAGTHEEDPIMGPGGEKSVRISSGEEGKVWFEWDFESPREGYFELRLLDSSGEPLVDSEELHDSKWCYDSATNGPLPERFQIEIRTWESINGLEELGDTYLQGFPSSD